VAVIKRLGVRRLIAGKPASTVMLKRKSCPGKQPGRELLGLAWLGLEDYWKSGDS
jgi:hypothetical protein